MRPKPWVAEFDETGGYDCMYGAWIIKDSAGETVAVVDQQHYGQKSCDWAFRSKEAEEIAGLISSASGQITRTK